MKKIIAIGGGEIGRPGFPIETTSIDKEIIKLTRKKNPSLLFSRQQVEILNHTIKLLKIILAKS